MKLKEKLKLTGIRKMQKLFSTESLVIDDIDKPLRQLGLLSRPLEEIRGEKEGEETPQPKKTSKKKFKGKFWQVFFLVNIYTDAVHWFLVLLMERFNPEITPENIRMKKLWGDFGFFTGGIPAFVHFMLFVLMLAGGIFPTLFAYGEYFENEKYLNWLDIILALKGKRARSNPPMPLDVRMRLVLYWKFLSPVRFVGNNVVGPTVALCYGGLLFFGYGTEPRDVFLTVFWSLRNAVSGIYISKVVFTMLVYGIIITEYLRLRFKHVNVEADKLIVLAKRTETFYNPVVRAHLSHARLLKEFNSVCVTVSKFNATFDVYVSMMYGFAIPSVALPIYHVLNAEALWIEQAALLIIGIAAAQYLFVIILYFAAMSATAHKFYKRLHRLQTVPFLKSRKRKTFSTFVCLTAGPQIGFTCRHIFTVTYMAYYGFIAFIGEYYFLTAEMVMKSTGENCEFC